ncbi:MAG: hypothetical protein ACRYG2_11380, partial [Janthinobacterium lividum]
MARHPAVSDETITKVLGGYAGLVHRVLTDPQRWLGLDEDPPPSAPVPLRVLDAVRDRAFGKTTPASPRWDELALKKRVGWWLRRIAVSAGLAAAAPRLAGALADRIPLQAGLSASSTGLAVCATAREHGITDAQAWVPLLAKVLFDRDLAPRYVPVPGSAESDAALGGAASEEIAKATSGGRSPAAGSGAGSGAGARRAAATVWQLARGFRELSSMLDERPHGLLVWRAVGKLPVVGLAGGWLDERGAIRRASRRTAKLLR